MLNLSLRRSGHEEVYYERNLQAGSGSGTVFLPTAQPTSASPQVNSNVAVYIYIFFGAMASIGLLALGIYCFHQRRMRRYVSSDNVNNNMQRYTLVDSFLEAGMVEWVCSICYHENHPAKGNCIMCGAPQVVTDSVLPTPRAEEGQHTSPPTPMNGGISSSASRGFDFAAKQRSLHVRRLNMHTLTQRQRGARRRTVWRRVKGEDSQLRWVRAEPGPTTRVGILSASDGNPAHEDYVIAESPAMLHSAGKGRDIKTPVDLPQISVGFVRQEDDQGNVTWVPADQVRMTDVLEVDDEDARQSTIIDIEAVTAKPFRLKVRWFLEELERIAVPWEEGHLLLKIKRDAVLHESMHLLMLVPPSDLRQRLRIEFIDEPGLDAGGLMREWILLLCHQLFDEELGLFQRTDVEHVGYWINPSSGLVNPDHLKYFQFVGRLIAKALLEGQVFTGHFALPLFKHLLGVPISFSDLEFLDEELFKNCMWVKDHDGISDLCLTFSVTQAGPDGSMEIIDLKPNGRDIDVTDDNKIEYLNLLLKHYMLDSISDQLSALLKGLYEIIPQTLLNVFDYQEMELLLCGVPEIDVTDWEAHTDLKYQDYDHPSKQEQKVVKWFWEVVGSWEQDWRAKLLQFVTGTSRVPVEGFKALVSNDGRIRRFGIQIVPKGTPPTGLYPKAHTCFNRIDLPLYDTKEDLETYLSLVVNMEITGFSMQ